MDSVTTLARLRTTAASAGTLLLLSAVFAIYQMTSLTLGFQPSRQFNLSLSAPSVDLQDPGSPFSGGLDSVLGERGPVANPRLAVAAPLAAHAAPILGAAAPAPAATTRQKPAATVPTTPVVIPVPEPGTVTGSHYHDADVRGLRLARGRRPGSRG